MALLKAGSFDFVALHVPMQRSTLAGKKKELEELAEWVVLNMAMGKNGMSR